MTPVNESELDCAENCAQRSHFLEWLREIEDQKLQDMPEEAACGGGNNQRA